MRVPVIAAGGVADGRTVAAAFVLGASAVQLGTAFLRCEEANVVDAHRAALREPTDACTVVTDMITGRPARYMKNELIEDLFSQPVVYRCDFGSRRAGTRFNRTARSCPGVVKDIHAYFLSRIRGLHGDH